MATGFENVKVIYDIDKHCNVIPEKAEIIYQNGSMFWRSNMYVLTENPRTKKQC